MTQQDYLIQNLAGFESDYFAKEKFKKLIEENNIEVFIETGTFLGSTTLLLSQWCEEVHTIEVNEINYFKAKEALKYTNVKMYLGSSENILNQILPKVKLSRIGIFADAHWNTYNPLIDELNTIASSGIKPIFIAIHDFKNPNHPEFGFDTYNGQDYEWSWIEQYIKNIYGEDGFIIEYNSEATGAKRGIIFIYKK